MRCKITTKLGTVGRVVCFFSNWGWCVWDLLLFQTWDGGGACCMFCFVFLFKLGMVYLGFDPVLLLFRLLHCDTANAGEEPPPFGCRTRHPISGLETGPLHSICILMLPHLQSPPPPGPPERYIYIFILFTHKSFSLLKLKIKENHKRFIDIKLKCSDLYSPRR